MCGLLSHPGLMPARRRAGLGLFKICLHHQQVVVALDGQVALFIAVEVHGSVFGFVEVGVVAEVEAHFQ